jgi:hypothetical protein
LSAAGGDENLKLNFMWPYSSAANTTIKPKMTTFLKTTLLIWGLQIVQKYTVAYVVGISLGIFQDVS